MIEAVMVSVGCADQLRRTLPWNALQVDRVVVVTAHRDAETLRIVRSVEQAGLPVAPVLSESHRRHAVLNKGWMLDDGLQAVDKPWVVFTDADCFLPPEMDMLVGRLDPENLYYTVRKHVPADCPRRLLSKVVTHYDTDPGGNFAPWGYFQLFNVSQARYLGAIPVTDRFCSAGCVDHWFSHRWAPANRKPLGTGYEVLHLWHGPLATRWNGHGIEREPGLWYFGGQTTSHPEPVLQRTWPSPCWVRRTHILTLDSVTTWFDGSAQWESPTVPGQPYEFAVKVDE